MLASEPENMTGENKTKGKWAAVQSVEHNTEIETGLYTQRGTTKPTKNEKHKTNFIIMVNDKNHCGVGWELIDFIGVKYSSLVIELTNIFLDFVRIFKLSHCKILVPIHLAAEMFPILKTLTCRLCSRTHA